MSLRRFFTEHPAAMGETYAQHQRVALTYAGPLALAAAAALCHAIFPFLFKTTASDIVRRLNERISARCGRCPSGRLHRPDLFESDAEGLPRLRAG